MNENGRAGITRPKHARHLASLVVLRFTYATVAAIATLFGALCLVAAATEVIVGAVSSRGWRMTRWFVAAAFVVAGVVAYLAVKTTVIGLAAVMSVLFILWGALGVVVAIAVHRNIGWWVLLILGLAQLAIGSAILGSLQMSITALLIWVATGTVIHGIGEISSAFAVREIGQHLTAKRA
jgi:uncharacterized membrane protein HdeD (DUF308 family)